MPRILPLLFLAALPALLQDRGHEDVRCAGRLEAAQDQERPDVDDAIGEHPVVEVVEAVAAVVSDPRVITRPMAGAEDPNLPARRSGMKVM